jgi:hypothetical protein
MFPRLQMGNINKKEFMSEVLVLILMIVFLVLFCKNMGQCNRFLSLNTPRGIKQYYFKKVKQRKVLLLMFLHLKGIFFMCKTNLGIIALVRFR